MDSDEDLVKKLRNDFPEQFMSLVKMHLSFCLDQSTDEVDCLTPQNKLQEKRSLANQKNKSRLPKQAPVINEGIKYAFQINQLIDYLSRPNSLIQEGIFRRNGKVKQQHELMVLIKEKNEKEISSLLESNQYSVHEVATVLKNLLAEMPEPLLVESYYPLHCSLAKLQHPQRQIRGCQMLVLLLPTENADILCRLLKMLHQVSMNEDTNKMNAMNLGIVLAPHILCPRKMSAEDLTTNASSLAHIVSFMIENAKVLFHLPPEFVSDVRLHFKRDNEEDASSNASTPPVKTTITFVDREMTAKVVAEVGLDPTEAALAELYAYVQSQPESEVKKKWVHKFNKENGCGTPKVILNSSLTDACAKNCKNLSQSIRKHLFNGTGVTPKRRRSKSSSRAHAALCYSGEKSPDNGIAIGDIRSPSLKSSRPYGSHRSLLESTPTNVDYIRHPAYVKNVSRNANATPLPSIPAELAKENIINQDQVISPLAQTRFPFYVRDSIMTPRCRKPVFTFSPIDEPDDIHDDLPSSDDRVAKSSALQMLNPVTVISNTLSQTEKVISESASHTPGEIDEKEEELATPIDQSGVDLATTVDQSDADFATSVDQSDADLATSVDQSDTDLATSIDQTDDELATPIDQSGVDLAITVDQSDTDFATSVDQLDTDLATSVDQTDDELATPIDQSDTDFATTDDQSDASLTEDSDHSFLSGCALIQESKGPLTSPFKNYLMSRQMQVFDEESGEESDDPQDDKQDCENLSATVNSDLLEAENAISKSLLEFLDGESSTDSDDRPHSSPTTRPSPPLTKSILFETSL